MGKLHTITTPRNARFRFIQDDSGHWYSIPEKERDKFLEQLDADREAEEKCLYEDSDEGFPESTFEFDDCRLDMHPSNYTFENLQEKP